MKCEICNKEFASYIGLAKHISSSEHFQIKDYYDKYIRKEGEGMCSCGQPTKFVGLSQGYQQFCSKKCSNNMEGKHKPREIVEEQLDVECQACNSKFKSLQSLSNHLMHNQKNNSHPTIKEYYDMHLKKEGEGNCITCGKPSNFAGLVKGYNPYCSRKCSISDSKNRILKSQQTIKEKYGVDNASQLDWVKQKKIDTCKENYGVDHPQQNRAIIEKSNQSNLEKYGTIRASQNEEIKRKIIATAKLHSEESQIKHVNTIKDKYGVENISQIQRVKDIKAKKSFEKFGTKSPMQNTEVRQKLKSNNIKKYGVPYATQNPEIAKKISDTKKKLFFESFFTSGRLKNICTPNFRVDEYKGSDFLYSWICTKCNNEFKDHLQDGKIPKCPICNPPKMVSNLEKEIAEFCRTICGKIETTCRNIIPSYEIDIYLPEKQIAIEFNGLYWHSELSGGKSKQYHSTKTALCNKNNIQLVQIFEDEWLTRKPIVESILRSKVGIYTNRIYARQCEVSSDLRNYDVDGFLNDNHLQGPIGSSIQIGLVFNSELVCVATFGKSRFNKNYEYELLRYCSLKNYQIVGGFSKILNHFIKKYDPLSIITYADARYSQGDVYRKTGFNYLYLAAPNYYYLSKRYDVRESRMKYQKHKLHDLLESYDSNLTEWENMQLNGFDRIWDCGNYVFEWRKKERGF